MKYGLVIEKGSDGFFTAECLTLRGCISQGKTLKSALHNIGDAMEGYMESLRKHDEKVSEVVV
ncbi:type II toxin-antitoxin system HicB family antitoxin [Candidatus Woesearchaeota archaeon]|nr:type II toxin-antitoxin system HicB family antitoxin [Candidatus Woesearchaeota archaeon]